MAILNDRIKETRKKRGLTLLQLADILGVKEATVQRYESGEIKNIKYDTIISLANALHVHPAYLMGWSDENGNTVHNQKDGILIQDTIEREIIEIYRKLAPEAKDNARKYIGYLLFQQQEKEEDAAREAEKQRMLDELRKIEDQEEFEKLLTASYAAWGGQHGTVKLTEEGLKEFIKLIKEDQKK